MADTEEHLEWLVGGGEAGGLIRSMNWAATPLGARDRWPNALRTVVQLVVESRFPMALLWGRELILLYNDAYRVICADKHPRAMGRSTRKIWPEVWDINEPIVAAVLERGETVYLEDKLFPVDRRGQMEHAYFTLCYSPVRGEGGVVAGSLVTLLETTTRVREHDALLAALQEKEERLRLAIDTTGIGAFDFYPQTGRMEWSSNINEQLGLRPLEVPDYDTFLRAIHPADRDRIDRLVRESLRPGSGGDYVAEYRTAGIGDGHERWLSARGRVLRDEDGRAMRFVGVTLDITDRRRAEDVLRTREADLARAQAAAHLGSWRWDLQNDRVTWSEELYRIFGVDRQTFVPTNAAANQLVHPEDRARHAELAAMALEGQPVPPFESRIIRPSGEERVVQASGFEAEFDAVGKPTFLFGTVLDITERKRAEEALRETLARLKKVFDVETVGVAFWDLTTGTMTDANDAFLTLMGYSRRDVEGGDLTWQKLTPREFMEVSRAEVQKFLETGHVGPYEKEYIRKDGTRRWIVFAGTSLGPHACVEFCVDISPLKNAEAELRQSEERFRALVEASSQVLYRMNADWSEMLALRGGDFLADAARPNPKRRPRRS